MICKILRLFVNTLTPDDKYPLLNRDNSMQAIHIQLSQKKNLFSNFFYIFEVYIKFGTVSKKRWTSYLMYFRNYGLQKTWLDNCVKKPLSECCSRTNMVNGPKHFLKSERRSLYHIYLSLRRQMRRKMSLLVISKILKLLLNTFTADEKYSFLNRDNLMQPIHMELSQ